MDDDVVVCRGYKQKQVEALRQGNHKHLQEQIENYMLQAYLN